MADNIKVVIKVRPLIKREIDDSLQKQWTVSDNTIFPTAQQFGREGMGEFTFGEYVRRFALLIIKLVYFANRL